MLQEVGVLLQQPLNSDLGVVPSVRLHRQLLLEDVDLRKIQHASRHSPTREVSLISREKR